MVGRPSEPPVWRRGPDGRPETTRPIVPDAVVDVEACAEILRRATTLRPKVLVALGSGLGRVLDDVDVAASVPLHRLPGMPAPGVAGHAGRLVAGRLVGVPVWIQAGRLHAYEGHPASLVAAPVRMAARLGVEVIILTNAAGGIRWDLEPGTIVLLSDLLNLSFRDPGPPARDRAGRRRRNVFDASLQDLVLETAGDLVGESVGAQDLRLRRGTYAGVLGPSFETPAEIRMIRRLGGDVVGMSTVPEALVARELGLRTVGLSLVTNRAAGLQRESLSHEEVVSAALERGPVLGALLREVVEALDGPRG